MSKTTPDVDEAALVTITEACRRISATDPRVELLSAFHAIESAKRPGKNTVEHFRKQLDAFARQPI